jgi:glycosyltransferase involved in cell wall biosynthesis
VPDEKEKSWPLVSVIICTYNRRAFLPVALGSAINQSYANLQIIVVRDGGCEVSDIIEASGDGRIVFIDRSENRGKAFSLNEALAKAEGKYIAYLDDDDLYYPEHIGCLVEVLEKNSGYGAAYSDLYRVCCHLMPDGTRRVLSKVVNISRDFDRFFLLFINNVLHVSLMHRRDLLSKAGFYNESLNMLIDWDMTRMLAFFTDFYHVNKVTGEFYCPVGESDRISVVQRADEKNYVRNLLTIRTTRPAKPWDKLGDLAIIFLADRFDKTAGKTIGSIWHNTFYPYKLYLPAFEGQLEKINIAMPGLEKVAVAEGAGDTAKIDAVLPNCDAEYVAIVQAGFGVGQMWVEDALYALINNPAATGYMLKDSDSVNFGGVFRVEAVRGVRERFKDLSFSDSLEAGGIVMREVGPEEKPFKFDKLFDQALREEKQGSWCKAGEIFEFIGENYDNRLWMFSRAAKAYYGAGSYDKVLELCEEVNSQEATPATLLLEAKVRKGRKDYDGAILLLERAEEILEGKDLIWT